MAELSPAAASIVQAFDDRYELLGGLEENWQEDCLAAALRVAADQVAPMTTPLSHEAFMAALGVRFKLLAIAAEMEGITP